MAVFIIIKEHYGAIRLLHLEIRHYLLYDVILRCRLGPRVKLPNLCSLMCAAPKVGFYVVDHGGPRPLHHQGRRGHPNPHEGEIITQGPNRMWGTDGAKVFTVEKLGLAFVAVEH